MIIDEDQLNGAKDFVHTMRGVLDRNPEAHVLVFCGDDPTVTTIFDDYGPADVIAAKAAACNKQKSPLTAEVLFTGGIGSFESWPVKAALYWLSRDIPWSWLSLAEYGDYMSIHGCAPARVVKAYKRYIDCI